MGFWFFILIMDLLMPFSMLLFGRIFQKRPPKRINSVFGYRTVRSMKTCESWAFAHHHCGRIWYACGWGSMAAALIILLFSIGQDIDTLAIIGGVVCFLEIIVLLLPIFFTESALKKNFDSAGKRK